MYIFITQLLLYLNIYYLCLFIYYNIMTHQFHVFKFLSYSFCFKQNFQLSCSSKILNYVLIWSQNFTNQMYCWHLHYNFCLKNSVKHIIVFKCVSLVWNLVYTFNSYATKLIKLTTRIDMYEVFLKKMILINVWIDSLKKGLYRLIDKIINFI